MFVLDRTGFCVCFSVFRLLLLGLLNKRTVKYKTNVEPTAFMSVKEFFLVKYFRNKLKEFLQVVDIHSTF